MYLPEIIIKGYDRWISVYVGEAKVGEFFENEETTKLLDQMFAKMIRQHFEAEGVNFLPEEVEEDW